LALDGGLSQRHDRVINVLAGETSGDLDDRLRVRCHDPEDRVIAGSNNFGADPKGGDAVDLDDRDRDHSACGEIGERGLVR
jgi:hypothetical protein